MGKILAICISEKKGVQKEPVDEATLIEDWGIEKDAHGGKWHRQVSLLSFEKIEGFRAKGAEVDFGDFGENLVVEGFDLRQVPVGTRFQIGEAILELTQIGKECHSHCAIFHAVGDCIMPREGVFTQVIKGGKIKTGDTIEMLPLPDDRPFTAAVVWSMYCPSWNMAWVSSEGQRGNAGVVRGVYFRDTGEQSGDLDRSVFHIL